MVKSVPLMRFSMARMRCAEDEPRVAVRPPERVIFVVLSRPPGMLPSTALPMETEILVAPVAHIRSEFLDAILVLGDGLVESVHLDGQATAVLAASSYRDSAGERTGRG